MNCRSARLALLIFAHLSSYPLLILILSSGISSTVASHIRTHVAGQRIPSDTLAHEVKSPIKLRIANGGAGQSRLLRALADAFTDDYVRERKCEPFAVSWIKSDTTASFNHLADGSAALSITYDGAAEEIAIEQGTADRRVYAWRDRFLLVRPKSNPANLTVSSNTTIQALFSQLFITAIASDNTVRFLGSTPWSYPFSFFYYVNLEFPYQALATAAKLQEYTLADRGTWCGVEPWIRKKMMTFMEGRDDDKTDIMLLPAHALVGAYGENKAVADAFAVWITRSDDGQKVLSEFERDGVLIYIKAP